MSPKVVVLDYGSGNLRSACRAIEHTGADVVLTSDTRTAGAADGLVVPGVGAYAACMAGLERVGGVDLIRRRAEAGRPLLGICVGFQVLFENGIEHGVESSGCGILSGTVERLAAERLPHMGWNTVRPPVGSALFERLSDQRFYFVHSYGVHGSGQNEGVTWCAHESDRFVAAIEREAIQGTQFHPEKSGLAGARLLRNWVANLSV